MWDKSVIEDVLARTDLAALVGGRVDLRRSGSSLKGLCPFHSDRNPSFHVYPDSGNCICYSCGWRGDALDYLEQAEGLGFTDALPRLASLAGVALPEPEEAPELRAARERRERLTALLRRATQAFVLALREPVGAAALAYLTGRGLTDAILGHWGIGYAPPGHVIRESIAAWGFTEEEGLAAGLLARRDDGPLRDRFWDRITFPLLDRSGRLVGFAGRSLGDRMPKYLNSPQSDLFTKRSLLYGLTQARPALRRTREVVVVEGYMDVIAAHAAGHENVVAQMGTMITDEQLALLAGAAERIILGLDSDKAGELATDRAIGKLIAAGLLDALVLDLPGGKDPDEFIRSGGDWGAAVAAAKPLPTHLIRAAAAAANPDRPGETSKAIRDLLGLLRAVRDPLARDHYEGQIALAFGLERAMLDRLAGRRGAAPPPRPSAPPPALLALPPVDREAYLLGLYLAYPEVAQALEWDLDPADLAAADLRALYATAAPVAALGGGPGAVMGALTGPHAERAESLIMSTWERFGPEYPEAVRDATATLTVVRAARRDARRQELIAGIREAVAQGDRALAASRAAALRDLAASA